MTWVKAVHNLFGGAPAAEDAQPRPARQPSLGAGVGRVLGPPPPAAAVPKPANGTAAPAVHAPTSAPTFGAVATRLFIPSPGRTQHRPPPPAPQLGSVVTRLFAPTDKPGRG